MSGKNESRDIDPQESCGGSELAKSSKIVL